MVCILGVFGGISIIVVGIQILRGVFPWLYENIFGPCMGTNLLERINTFGDWAIVTGATDGIGKAYAKALAKRGLNIVLISRTRSKLEVVAKEIEATCSVQTKIVDVDFTKGGEIYQRIEKEISGLNVAVLVNNVGMSYDHPENFLAMPIQKSLEIIECNINSVVNMCKLVLPGLVAKKKGVIINLASLAAKIPNPLLAIYSATKSFVDKFSGDLQTEYRDDGIIIQSVLPGFVATNMSKIKKPTLMSPSADKYAECALKRVGVATHTTGYLPHALMLLFINTMGFLLPTVTENMVLKQLQTIRARALRKR